jgi:hypothetical protein
MHKSCDLTGQRFGRVLVKTWIRPDGRGTHSKYQCVCDCGKEWIVSVNNIRRIKSCGCLAREQYTAKMLAQQEDLTGKVFGEWRVLRRGEKRSQNWHWVCQCSCGAIREVASYHLRKGNSSCCIQCSGKKNSERSKAKRKSPNGRWLYRWGLQENYSASVRQEQYDAQKGICPVCGKPLYPESSSWAWDHDHNTGECRELLHTGCNVFIGRIENNPDIIARATNYLERYSARV